MLFISAAIASSLAVLVPSTRFENKQSKIVLGNLEALTHDEEKKDKEEEEFYHLWCCGTSGTCLECDNLIIVGKRSSTPCE